VLAQKLFTSGRQNKHVEQTLNIDEVKERLNKIRNYTRDNIKRLDQKLRSSLRRKYSGVKVHSAADNTAAIAYIAQIAGGINTISINESGVISRELKPGLIAEGFTIVNSYCNEFNLAETTIPDIQEPPCLLGNGIPGGFDVSIRMDGIDCSNIVGGERKKYLAVLGVNAASCEDGTIFFLQHYYNIYKDLQQAEKIVLVIGLDKIVKSREDASFVTECMGIFGMETILTDMKTKAHETPSMACLPLTTGSSSQELHTIILDNGRTGLLQDNFSDLLLCIGCRACKRRCPIVIAFKETDYIWSPQNYLRCFLDRKSGSIDMCLHCEACRLDCPLDIDLPDMMWKAMTVENNNKAIPFRNRVLGRSEVLARLGVFLAPLSNILMNLRLIKIFIEYTVGIDRKANLPGFRRLTFRRWFNKK